MPNLHKLVYMHYNIRLKVQNLFMRQQDVDYYNPSNLNHISTVDDILGSQNCEEEPIPDGKSTNWIEGGL